MSKIDPRDGLKYLTNLGLRFLANTRLANITNTKGEPIWTSLKLGQLLEEHGYIKLKYTGKGKPYTYFCIKGITQTEVEKLVQLDSVYKSDQESKNNTNIAEQKSG